MVWGMNGWEMNGGIRQHQATETLPGGGGDSWQRQECHLKGPQHCFRRPSEYLEQEEEGYWGPQTRRKATEGSKQADEKGRVWKPRHEQGREHDSFWQPTGRVSAMLGEDETRIPRTGKCRARLVRFGGMPNCRRDGMDWHWAAV